MKALKHRYQEAARITWALNNYIITRTGKSARRWRVTRNSRAMAKVHQSWDQLLM